MANNANETKPDQKPVYAGIVTAGGITVWLLQSAIPTEQKITYIAMLGVATFAVGIVRFFLMQYDQHIEKHGVALTRLLENQASQHLEHVEICNTLTVICQSLGAKYEPIQVKEAKIKT